jgi:predicted Ser/Thr protein kinase
LRKWDNVTIEKQVNTTQNGYVTNTKTEDSFKVFGINFYDENIDKFIIISNAVPCIIEYDVETTNKTTPNVTTTTNTTSNDKPSKDELRNSWKTLDAEYDSIREQMKGMDKNSDEYKTLKSKRTDIQKKKMEVENLMFKHYNGFIN